MRKIKVKNVIIGKQFENSENYQEFIKIVNEKNIKTYVIEAGQMVNIEENLYFDVLWPSCNDVVTENVLNNNSLVCKLVYKNFSMIFAGDIEEIAENAIVKKYEKNLDKLKSTVLKVAHHGSKTSSNIKFLNVIKPKIALIGVGENNNFGHPNEEILERLNNMQCGIYRTDVNGEISLKVNRKGEIKVDCINLTKTVNTTKKVWIKER